MKKLTGLILLLFFSLIGIVNSETISIGGFGGINTDDDPMVIGNQTPDSEDALTDDGQGLRAREGFVSYSTEPSKQSWVFPLADGTKYIINSYGGVLKADDGDGVFDIYVGTVDSTVNTSAVGFGDKFFFTNVTDGLKRWDISTVELVTGTYKAYIVVSHKSRLWLAGVVGDERTIYGSQYTDGEDFALDTYPNNNSPTRIQVQGSLDDVLTGLFATYNDMLMWFKNNSFGAIYGSRRSNYGSREYSDSVGTFYPESIKNCDGRLRWLANNNKYYEFNGENYYSISKDIDELVKTVAQGESTKGTFVLTTKNDWNSGKGEKDNDDAIKANLLSTEEVIGSIKKIGGHTAEDLFANDSAWTESSGSSWAIVNSSNGAGGNSNELSFSTANSTFDRGYRGTFQTTSTLNNTTWYINRYIQNDSGYSIPLGSDMESELYYFLYNSSTSWCRAGTYNVDNWSRIGKIECSEYTGTFNDTVFSKNDYWTKGYKISYEDNIVGLWMCDAIDDDITKWENCSQIASAELGYYPSSSTQFMIKLDMGDYPEWWGNASFDIDNWRLKSIYDKWNGIYSNIFWRSSTKTITGEFTWSAVNYSHDTEGSPTLNIAICNPSCTNVADGATPSNSATSPFQVRAEFRGNTAADKITLHNVNVGYTNGSALPSPSIYYNERFLNSVAISSETNNKILVYDRNNQWQKWGIPVNSFFIYNGNQYFGNVNGIFKMNTGNDDNGELIPAYYTTKDYLLKNPDVYKQFNYLHITAKNSNSLLVTKFYIDQYSTEYSLSDYNMNTDLGIQNSRLPFPMNQKQDGKTITFKFLVESSNDWRLLNANLYYQSDTEPED